MVNKYLLEKKGTETDSIYFVTGKIPKLLGPFKQSLVR